MASERCLCLKYFLGGVNPLNHIAILYLFYRPETSRSTVASWICEVLVGFGEFCRTVNPQPQILFFNRLFKNNAPVGYPDTDTENRRGKGPKSQA